MAAVLPALARDGDLPLYQQLKLRLLGKIRSGEWRAGDLIPGEHELQTTFAVSRTTVRQALRELELEGLLSRYRGRGTFVARPKLTHDPEPSRNLEAAVSDQGLTATWTVLAADWIDPPEDVADRLKVPIFERVFRLRRVRLVNHEPIGHHTAYVAPAFADAIDTGALESGSSLHYLEKHVALASAVVERLLEAVSATEEDADLLGTTEGAPMLRIRRVVMGKGGEPIEDCRSVYRGDRFQYHLRATLALPGRPFE
jgi:GntR family transcriptional regulator